MIKNAVLTILLLTLTNHAFSYSNPLLKVLLRDQVYSVVINSKTNIFVNGKKLGEGSTKRIIVKRIDSNRLSVDNYYTFKKKITLESYSLLNFKGRKYYGKLEIRPYGKGLRIINHIPTEKYIEGVLNAEISTRWHPEVVKAQAVIARTFALHRRRKRKKSLWYLGSSAFDQVYKGEGISDEFGVDAINKTRGYVVTHKGHLIPTFYHSNGGGMTEDAGNVWQYSMSHIVSVVDPYGKSDPNYQWEVLLAEDDLRNILIRTGFTPFAVSDVFISRRTSSNRCGQIVFGAGEDVYTLHCTKFRKFAGYTKIKSLMFNITRVPEGYLFSGKGNGHGVGLSQWGAKELAEKGYSFIDILNFYYNDIEVEVYSGS